MALHDRLLSILKVEYNYILIIRCLPRKIFHLWKFLENGFSVQNGLENGKNVFF